MSRAQDFRAPARTTPDGWTASDLDPAGAVGEAHLATAKNGGMIARHQVGGLVDLLRAVRVMPLVDR